MEFGAITSHEMTHCLQIEKLGLLNSKSIENIPNWKWEGFAEYISRHNSEQKYLIKNIEGLLQIDKTNFKISFTDNIISPKGYYNYWILVQYCIDIKKVKCSQFLADTTHEETFRSEMMNLYYKNYN